MTHGTLTTALVLAILAGISLEAAQAQGNAGRQGQAFEAMDSNGDGRLTRAEIEAHRAARLARMDTNGDQSLTEAELRAGMKARSDERIERRIGKMMDRLDSDGDGRVKIDEIKPRQGGKMFDRADTNGDGAISRDEFEAMRAKRKDRG